MMDGKVALVTGGGGGLGRAYALLLAREGAKVVVNDLGRNRHGEGEPTSLAEEVVTEIQAAGGEAVANDDSVSDRGGAEAMVEAAFEAFGRLDIVINNAGILRDKTLVRMDDAMWDAVMAVHLKGTFLVSRHAVRRMMKAGIAGRIVNTSSYAGLKGNFGQTNYGAAKAGIAGFTRSLALEGQRFGITVNAIAPVAKTRMTAELDMVPESFAADDVAPLVVWLCSDEAQGVTGRVFGAHGRHYFEYVVETTPGVELGEGWTPAAVGENFASITAAAAKAVQAKSASEEGPNRAALGKRFEPAARVISSEEIQAYARAVDEENPRYLGAEGKPPEVAAPLFSVQPLFEALETAMGDKELDADLLRLVHGEQEMVFHDVLRPGDLVAPSSEIGSIVEKSSGWLIDIKQKLLRDGEVVVEARSGLFVRRPKASGAASKSKASKNKDSKDKDSKNKVTRTPIYEESQVVAPDQPRRYAEASGDRNPIHLDRSVAQSAGLPDVILHGLCTMAFAARALVDGVLDGKVEDLARMKVRFASPVVPGTKLNVRVYQGSGEADLEFEMVDDSGRSVLTHGEADRR